MNDRAVFVKFLRHGVADGAPDAADHNGDFFLSVGFGSATERSDKIMQAVALREAVQPLGGCADDLEHNRHAPRRAVEIGNGERDALAVRVGTQDDELSRLCLFRNRGRMNAHERYGRIQRSFFKNFVHKQTPFAGNLPKPLVKRRFIVYNRRK